MKMQQDTHKIDYVKPQILDLGAVTSILGGTCNPGGGYTNPCATAGLSPHDTCFTPGALAFSCGSGTARTT